MSQQYSIIHADVIYITLFIAKHLGISARPAPPPTPHRPVLGSAAVKNLE